MHLETKIFNSTISRRIFTNFVICAIVPIGCLAVLTLYKVTAHLHDYTVNDLRNSAKSQAKTVFDRMNSIEEELSLLNSVANRLAQFEPQGLDTRLRSRLLKRFHSIAIFENPTKLQPFLNPIPTESLNLVPDDFDHLLAGKSLLVELEVNNSQPKLLLIGQLETPKAPPIFLVAELNVDYLLGTSQTANLPLDTEFCVLDSSYNLMYTSQPSLSLNPALWDRKVQLSTTGHFDFDAAGKEYFASYTQLFLKPNYKISHWTIILYRAKSDVYVHMEEFKRIFPLFLILALIVVVWLSIVNIRKNLVPIETLKMGVQRIAERDFSQKVSVSSNDEFEELAAAFNEMSDALKHNFQTLSARADIDRAILSSLTQEDIIKAAVTGLPDCLSSKDFGISLFDEDRFPHSLVFYKSSMHPQSILKTPAKIRAQDRMKLSKISDHLIIETDESLPDYIPKACNHPKRSFLILPIRFNNSLAAVLWIAPIGTEQFTTEDITLARQLADQIAVALTNSKLIEELKEMDWGTLKALARTVDAKSPWTAGHSQRVTDMALRIGSAVGLNPKELENLHRGALLHDIGKIGIPSAILNKESALSDDEFELIKRHPEMGVKIIEPISAFRGILSIIAQHHERFDGNGYPAGLVGDAIQQGARILAVADVYDSLLSDRPYRKKMTNEQIFQILRREAGKQFDPVIVEALLEVTKNDQEKAA